MSGKSEAYNRNNSGISHFILVIFVYREWLTCDMILILPGFPNYAGMPLMPVEKVGLDVTIQCC